MSNFSKKTLSFFLAILVFVAPVFSLTGVTGSAAEYDDINGSDVFLKQQTSITCTLSSAAMMFRRTAICAGYSKWNDINEESIRYKGWIDGVGLRWNFTSFGMTINHGYFGKDEKKDEVIALLEQYPQGYVIYNGGSQGQNHAVFLCDYDQENDTFYVADPANNAPEGRIKLEESSIVGDTQEQQIANLTAYWYIADPVVEFSDGKYTADANSVVPEQNISDQYDPTDDIKAFDSTRTDVAAYYVVSENSLSGSALRYHPSGNSAAAEYVKKGSILLITHKGQNKSGAMWYRTIHGTYIFSSNIIPYEEYSNDIKQFNKSMAPLTGTYAVVSADRSQPVALRIEPSEGNNIAAYVSDGHLLYIVEAGVNTVGAKWYKTEEGYYIKAAETKFISETKNEKAGFSETPIIITGQYGSKPVDDIVINENSDSVYYQVTASSLRVRLSPVEGEIAGNLMKGEVVKILEVKDGWGKMIFNGVECWISLEYAVPVDVTDFPVEIKSVKLSSQKIENGGKISCSVQVADERKYNYKFSLYTVDGKLITEYTADSENNNYVECEVTGAGYYYFRVDITDMSGRSAYGYSSNFIVYEKLLLDSVKCSKDGSYAEGQTIVWKAVADTLSATSVYNYALYRDGVLIDEISSVGNEFFCTPQIGGTYQLTVYISDEFSQSQKITSDPVVVYPMLVIDSIKLSTISAVAGSEITCKVSAAGGAGGYKYSFSVLNDKDEVEDCTVSDSDEVRITFDKAGTYKFSCNIIDAEEFSVSGVSDDILIYDIVKGDVDSDDKVTAKDARLTLRHSAMLELLNKDNHNAADINGDGKINAFDARSIMRYAAQIIDSFE